MAEKLTLVIDLDSGQVEKGLKKTERQVQTFGKKAREAFNVIGKAALGFTGAVGVGSVKAAADAEKAFAKLSTIAGKDTEKLKREIMAMDSALGTVEQQAEATYQAISAGRKPAEAVKFVTLAAQAAKGGFTDTATAVDAATTIMNTFGKRAGTAEQIFDKFLQTQNLGKTTFAEIAANIGDVAATANSAGLSFDELQGLIAATTAGGLQTTKAITGIRASLVNLSKPTKEGQELFRQLGFSTNEAFDPAKLRAFIGEEGILGLLEKIKAESPDVSQAMVDAFGSVEAKNAMEILIADLDKARQSTEAMTKAQSASADASTKMTKTLSGQIEALTTDLQKIAQGLGEKMLPKIREVTGGIRENIDELAKAAEWLATKLEGVADFVGQIAASAGTLMATGERVAAGDTRGAALAFGASEKQAQKVAEMEQAMAPSAWDAIPVFGAARKAWMAGSIYGRNDLGPSAKLAPGLMRHRGGWVRGFDGGGTLRSTERTASSADSVPVMMKPSEGVISTHGMDRLDRFMSSLNGTAPLPGGGGYGGESDPQARLKALKERVRAVFAQATTEGVVAGAEKGVGDKGDKRSASGAMFSGTLDSISSGVVDAAMSGDVKGAIKGFAGELQSLAMDALKQAVVSGLGGLLGGGGGGLFGGLFADGGRPPVGIPSIVGERGPEVFVPDRPGTIVPNEALGGPTFNFGDVVLGAGQPRQQGEEFIRYVADGLGRLAERGQIPHAARRLAKAGAGA